MTSVVFIVLATESKPVQACGVAVAHGRRAPPRWVIVLGVGRHAESVVVVRVVPGAAAGSTKVSEASPWLNSCALGGSRTGAAWGAAVVHVVVFVVETAWPPCPHLDDVFVVRWCSSVIHGDPRRRSPRVSTRWMR